MFIKEIKKQNKGYDKTFIYHRLMESYRTDRGPRQRTLLNLGKLTIPKNQWKLIADRIEAILNGQESLFTLPDEVETLAQHYAQLLLQKKVVLQRSVDEVETETVPEYETVDINSVTTTRVRTVGAEYTGLAMFRELGLDDCLRQGGFSSNQVNLATLSVVGRLVHPASERGTRHWLQHTSGLGELIGMDVRLLSHNALYRISDLLYANKTILERHLRHRERDLFSLRENIILYDLTNTYFAGEAKSNSKAERGHSKQKRHDRPLITLGLVLDELGFPKVSKLFSGNVSEGKTLLQMIKALQDEDRQVADSVQREGENRGVTVVLDAGLSWEANLSLLRSEGYDYVVVARNKPVDVSAMNPEQFVILKEKKDEKVEVALFEGDEEHVLYCKSSKRLLKETAMRERFQQRFEAGLAQIASSLIKKRGTKSYEKVLERIGRLKERYAPMGQFYRIDVTTEDGKVTAIRWHYEKEKEAQDRYSGSYFLRTTRKDLSEEAIWRLYGMLTQVEDAFRSLKEELNLRPIYHQKEERSDSHLFITVLAYHLLNSIQVRLRQRGIHIRWRRLRAFLSTHAFVTTSMTTQENKRIHIRGCSEPEPFHRQIYQALGLPLRPMKSKKVVE